MEKNIVLKGHSAKVFERKPYNIFIRMFAIESYHRTVTIPFVYFIILSKMKNMLEICVVQKLLLSNTEK